MPDRVFDSGIAAVTLVRHRVHHHGTVHRRGPAQNGFQCAGVVAVDRAEVGEAQIGEHVAAPRAFVAAAEHRQMGGERAGGGAVGAGVVVEDHDHRMPDGSDVLKVLEGQAPGQCAVPDDRHHTPVGGARVMETLARLSA